MTLLILFAISVISMFVCIYFALKYENEPTGLLAFFIFMACVILGAAIMSLEVEKKITNETVIERVEK